jgi:hypothetical protein
MPCLVPLVQELKFSPYMFGFRGYRCICFSHRVYKLDYSGKVGG